jgi:arginase/N-omega-hydroxy-L-arginine amidinohydrolase
MVVAAASGLWDSGHGAGLRPEQVIIIGGRDIDEEEAAMLAKAGVRIIAPAQTTPETILQAIGDAPIWVHVDWDVMEPDFIPAAYKVADGLMPQQLRDVFAALPKDKIAGIELAEFEAGDDAAANNAALAVLEEIITPLFK